jgi:hypothetical protein
VLEVVLVVMRDEVVLVVVVEREEEVVEVDRVVEVVDEGATLPPVIVANSTQLEDLAAG